MERAVIIATCVAVVLLGVLAWFWPAHAEQLPRGLGHPSGAAHWYDPSCCSMKDCEPVEPGAIRETEQGYWVKYLSSHGVVVEGLVPFGSPNIHPSHDAQEHACAIGRMPLCIYIPFAM